MKRRPNGKALRAPRPNVGIEAAYRRKMRELIAEMARSYQHWIEAQYRATPPEMAMDATPASQLRIELNRLARRWQRRFDEAAPRLARFFQRSAGAQSDRILKQILRDAGLSVKFTMTREMRDIIKATLAENVGLIRSIPQQYHTQVQTSVMTSVQAGRDLATLSRELVKHHGVSYRRAALIARDQNNKATSAMQRARQTALGLEEGVWLHSHGGKEPRKTHLDNHGKTFSISQGWHDPDPRVNKRIWPGELISCRCVWRPVVPGLT